MLQSAWALPEPAIRAGAGGTVGGSGPESESETGQEDEPTGGLCHQAGALWALGTATSWGPLQSHVECTSQDRKGVYPPALIAHGQGRP